MLHLKTKHVNFPSMCCLKSLTPSLSLGRRGVRLLITPSHMEAVHSRGGALHHHLHGPRGTWKHMHGYLHAGLIFKDESNATYMQLTSMI